MNEVFFNTINSHPKAGNPISKFAKKYIEAKIFMILCLKAYDSSIDSNSKLEEIRHIFLVHWLALTKKKNTATHSSKSNGDQIWHIIWIWMIENRLFRNWEFYKPMGFPLL